MTPYLMKNSIVPATLLLLVAHVPQLSAQENRPNVLFIAVDDMNDWIGCHGTTPAAMTIDIDQNGDDP